MVRNLITAEFERVRRDRGARVAIEALSEGRTLTFGGIGEAAEGLCRAFRRLPLAPSRPVALLVGNHSTLFPLLLACLRQRFVVLPLDGDTPISEATRVGLAFEAQALVTLEADEEEDGVSAPSVALPGGLRLQMLPRREPTIDFGEAALLKLTSGSTDAPKAVMCTEENLWHDGEHVAQAMGIHGDSVQLGAIPLAHSYALGNLVMPLLVHGARLVLRHGFIPPAFCRDVERCGVTVFAGVPFMFDRIVGAMALQQLPRPLSTLISAGAPIEASTVREFKQRFGVKIHSFYGSSETGGIAYDAADDVTEPLTVGTAMPGVEIALSPVDAPPTAGAGLVRVRSRAVGRGYAGEPASVSETSLVLRSGEFQTGDIGRFDEQGRLFLMGRVSPSINVAGRKVQPEEVERVLLQMPGVNEAAVLGVPDRVRGERLVACLVTADSRQGRGPGDAAIVTPLAVRRHCAAALAPHKIPREIVLLPELPRTSRGKVDRKALRRVLGC